MRWLRRRRRDERGFAAVMVATLTASGLFLGCAAIAVDTANWYSEVQKVQRAADAAALAGVPYLPYDLPNAGTRAREVAARNGYDNNDPDIVVTVEKGALASQLKVTISSTIQNDFGRAIGVGEATITRTAVADYKAPAPMGSPCNTFGNEPAAGTPTSSAITPAPASPWGATSTARGASPFPNCSSLPQLWATVEGPQTEKSNGDRYQNIKCTVSGTHECASNVNKEYRQEGYFWVIRVQPAAVNQPINLQLYDPAYIYTGKTCEFLPGTTSFDNNMNPYVTTDGKARYSSTSKDLAPLVSPSPFCSGDFLDSSLMTTSFVVREQTDSLDPMQGAVVSGANGPCIKQYTGTTSTPSYSALKSSSGTYNQQLARVFHNWTTMCTFTPTRSGDYYLQVRSNVTTAGGTAEANTNSRPAMIFNGNTAAAAAAGNTTAGSGVNSFAIRAVMPAGLEKAVAVSGYDRMPMFANAAGASSTFNLIRVLPGAAGQYIAFSFFDVADISVGATGTVTVTRPTDATGSIVTTPFPGGCRAEGAGAGAGTALTNCSAPVSNANNNGKLETMIIPIPSDYSCDVSSLGGCWYQVTVSFPGATEVNDITTWDATIVGDPVRLIE